MQTGSGSTCFCVSCFFQLEFITDQKVHLLSNSSKNLFAWDYYSPATTAMISNLFTSNLAKYKIQKEFWTKLKTICNNKFYGDIKEMRELLHFHSNITMALGLARNRVGLQISYRLCTRATWSRSHLLLSVGVERESSSCRAKLCSSQNCAQLESFHQNLL